MNKIASTLLGLSLAMSVPLAAHAEEILIAPVVVETFNVTTYMNGGVGQGEIAAMHRMAKEFPLRMTFSERKDGEFVADVPVVISDAKGNPVFEMQKAGPMLYVMLPNGQYKVSARFKGLTESQMVNITGKEGEDINFHWRGDVK